MERPSFVRCYDKIAIETFDFEDVRTETSRDQVVTYIFILQLLCVRMNVLTYFSRAIYSQYNYTVQSVSKTNLRFPNHVLADCCLACCCLLYFK